MPWGKSHYAAVKNCRAMQKTPRWLEFEADAADADVSCGLSAKRGNKAVFWAFKWPLCTRCDCMTSNKIINIFKRINSHIINLF